MSRAVTLKRGETPEQQRIRNVDNTALPDAAPTERAEGVDLQGGDFLHVYVRLNNGAAGATIVPWYWSKTNGLWHPSTAIAFTAADLSRRVEVRGEDAVYFQVTVLAAGDVDIWGSFSYEGSEG